MGFAKLESSAAATPAVTLSPAVAMAAELPLAVAESEFQPRLNITAWVESESESERYLFDPHKKLIQSNNEKQLGSGDPY